MLTCNTVLTVLRIQISMFQWMDLHALLRKFRKQVTRETQTKIVRAGAKGGDKILKMALLLNGRLGSLKYGSTAGEKTPDLRALFECFIYMYLKIGRCPNQRHSGCLQR